MNAIYLALSALHTRHLNLFKDQNDYQAPFAEFEQHWPSPCLIEHIDGKHYWRATDKKNTELFDSIEEALEFSFHEDIKQFYGSFWANGLCVERDDINFNLIQTWNDEDQEQLKENILGHCFAKIKARLPLSYFIGSTFGDDVVALEHDTGKVVLEKPGRKPHKVLADNLESFLLSLSPTTDIY